MADFHCESNGALPLHVQGRAGDAAYGGAAAPRDAGPPLLEQSQNTVTSTSHAPGRLPDGYEIAKCGCDCWFCEDCCMVKGMKLRAELIPIVKTFRSVMMISLTIDPTLFPSPAVAFRYVRRRRAVSRTIQDLRRGGYLHSPRYFYVIEWQKNTEQVHFHILLDASFIPFQTLLDSWSKHRPPGRGPVVGDRPAFGTVQFSKQDIKSPVHAAKYVTKYLTKFPPLGFPAWVMNMGADTTIRRYSTSRGFWGREYPEREPTGKKRQRLRQSYRARTANCGTLLNVFSIYEDLDQLTGELRESRTWEGQVYASHRIVEAIDDGGNPKRRRRSVPAESINDVETLIERHTGERVYWVRGRHHSHHRRAAA